jgi:SNF2 family DNA or RNA helicase
MSPENNNHPPLRPYQRQAVELGLNQSCALFFEMGLGKTRTALNYIPGRPSFNVVIAPISASHSWPTEAEKWRPDVKVINQVAHSKPQRDKKTAWALNSAKKHPTILLINYEQAVELFKATSKARQSIDKLIADESSYIKNHRAQRTKAALNLRKISGRGYILTGTPILQGPIDLWAQMQLISPRILSENYYSFRARYCVMGGFEKKQIIRYKNLDQLMKRIDPHIISITKDMAAPDLPPLTYQELHVKLSAPEMAAYKLIKKEAVMALPSGDYIPITTALTKMTKLLQAAQGFYYYEDEKLQRQVKVNGDSKRRAVIELLQGPLAGQNVIIWSIFTHEIKQLSREIMKAGFNCCSPALDFVTPLEAAEAFINTPHFNILIANPASLAYGMNLQKATVEIFLSNSFKYGDRTQAEARSHRLGQTKPVTIIDVLADETLDRKVLNILKGKGDLADLVTETLGKKTRVE